MSLSQSIVTLHFDSNTLINSKLVVAKVDKVLSSAKFWTDAIEMKMRKSFVELSKRTGPNIEREGTAEIIFLNLL